MHVTNFAAIWVTLLIGLASLPTALRAETPPDTLVIATTLDDLVSLDPAEIFEFTGDEIAGNTYERLIGYDLKDVSKIRGEVAESWTVSPDGKTFTFKIRRDTRFASGNPLTAEDVVFSLQRAVVLDKSPGFIIGQFGLTKDNVKDKIKQTGPYQFTMEVDKPYAPTLVLYCLTSTVASVVDKRLALQNEKDGDLGYNWPKTHYAGSGPFTIRDWRANEIVVLERNPNYGKPTPLARVIQRHLKEPATQRILLEKGDIDVARSLSSEELEAVSSNPDVRLLSAPKSTIYYLGLNQRNPNLTKPEVRKALKYLVDYQAIADTIMKNKVTVHQTFLPKGFLGAIDDAPYRLDVAKAKELLDKAGLSNGFAVRMDVRSTPDRIGIAQAIQRTFGLAGVQVQIIPGDGKQVLTKYRARQHDIFIGDWGADYHDPSSNADTFAANDDNSDNAKAKPLAWRNSWDPGTLTRMTRDALLERDLQKRASQYVDLQRAVMESGPYVFMFQGIEVVAVRRPVAGIVLGPSYATNSFAAARKD